MHGSLTLPHSQQKAQSITVKIECFGEIERLLPVILSLQYDTEVSIVDVLENVIRAYPEAKKILERCACAIGEDIIPRQTVLTADSTVVLLSPVAGG